MESQGIFQIHPIGGTNDEKSIFFARSARLYGGRRPELRHLPDSSYWLKLGYYAPCIVSLTEPCGGELNAALVQACACGLIGGAAALLGAALHHVKAHKSLHSLLAALFSVR